LDKREREGGRGREGEREREKGRRGEGEKGREGELKKWGDECNSNMFDSKIQQCTIIKNNNVR